MMDEGTGVQLLQGDCRERLRELEAESVHCVVTSPPYWSLRDYGTGRWEDGDGGCDHKQPPTLVGPKSTLRSDGRAHTGPYEGEKVLQIGIPYRDVCGKCGARRVDQQIGLEGSVESYLDAMVDVFREVRRVLRADGVCCVNMGDCYSGSWGNQGRKEERGTQRPINGPMIQNLEVGYPERKGGSAPELPAKNLLMLPSRLAIALQADGWILRSMIPWVKRSAMPCSATDRPGTAVEYVFIFSKRGKYYWDSDSVRRPHCRDWYQGRPVGTKKRMENLGPMSRNGKGQYDQEWETRDPAQMNPNGRNLRNSDFYFDSLDLAIEATRSELAHLLHLREKGGLLLDGEGEPLALDVNPQALADAHFASFPEKLVVPLIQAGSSEWGCCSACGAPWTRQVEDTPEYAALKQSQNWKEGRGETLDTGNEYGRSKRAAATKGQRTTGWAASCDCVAGIVPCVVLDPFAGSGTTSLVASKLGRRSIAIELSLPYTEIFNRRNSQKSLLL